MLNNGKDDLGKCDPRIDEGVFVGYSSSSKAYRVHNKRTLCIKESVHVILDETGDIKDLKNKDDDEPEELLQIQRDSLNESQAERTQDPTTVDSTGEFNEYVEPEEGLGLFDNAEPEDAVQPKDEDFGNKEDEADQIQPLTTKSGWKHKSLHPLDSLISPLNSGMHTRSKTRNLVAFLTFISHIEPKNIKEALKDVDWVNFMQNELHQFERNKYGTWSLGALIEL